MYIKALIIDDDLFIQQMLFDQIEDHLPQIKVLDTAISGKEGLEKINYHQPDLLFLDVELADMTGFELLQKSNFPQLQTIFVTSHNDYALKALRINALDYLIKPIQLEELLEAVKKFEENALQSKQTASIKNTLNNLEALVTNILPKEIAHEIQKNGKAKTTKRFELVTVLFTDIKNFTAHSIHLPPEELVEELHYIYSAFDRIVEKHNVEKIKTIGDAYMAAGGVPTSNLSNPIDTLNAAIEINQFILNYQRIRKIQGRTFFEIRIGIHSGPVIAGVVGSRKFAYDIWGETVNIAARMENRGKVGKINISHSTYQLIAGSEKFSFISRGKINVKGKGEMEMYFAEKKKLAPDEVK